MSLLDSQPAPQAGSETRVPDTPMRFIWATTKPHLPAASFAVVAVTIAAVIEVFEVYAISQLIDTFAAAEDREAQLDALLFWGATFFVLLVGREIAWRTSGFLGITWIIRQNATAYTSLYRYILDHSHTYFINRFAGALSNKISNAADGSSRIVDQTLWRLWPETISVVATLALFFQIHWSVGLGTLTIICIVVLFNLWRVRVRRPFVVAYSAASSKMRGEGVDVLTNVAAVRQYARKSDEFSRLTAVVDDRVRKDFKQWFMGEWTMVSNGAFGAFTILTMLIVVYLLLKAGQATAGNLVLVLILLSRISHTFNLLGMMMNGFVRQFGEVEEGLREVVQPYDITDTVNSIPLVTAGGKVSWENVRFEFGPNAVFNDFSLNIEAGQRVGLVGPSGAGKTTFVSLMLRQHEITSGAIMIDGQNIAEVSQDSLRQAIAVVPQEPMLFHRSIRENIAYGNPNATDAEIIAVAEKAQAHDFIMSLPEGYNTTVGERGVKLSGGQKQRVAIARAMLKDAPILILDEATSALDSESEVAIQRALHELMAGKTVIAIAHRLSTLREMDRIIVLENGQIVEDGNHNELLAEGGTYAKLWTHQAGGFLQD